MKNNSFYSAIKLQKIVILLCLVVFGNHIWAQTQYYVFRNTATGNYYMTVNNNGTSLASKQGFDPNTCVWTYNASNISITLNSNTYYLSYDRDGTGSSSNRYQFSNWGVAGSYTAAMAINGTTASCTVNNRSNGNGTNTIAYVRYADNNFSFSAYNNYFAIAQEVTITMHNNEMTSFSITGDNDHFTSIGEETFGHGNSSFQPKYTNYHFGNADHLYDANGESITSIPSPITTGITYSWSLEGIDAQYATVDNTGKISYTQTIPQREIQATLKCTAIHTNSNTIGYATKTITFTNTTYPYPPSITYTNSTTSAKVAVTLSYPETDNTVHIYYTTDGSQPSSSSTEYSGPFNVENNTIIKAIAIKNSTTNSSVVSETVHITNGIVANTVILNDYEDHNWSYYSDPDSPIKSLYPRNVKITYHGNGPMYTGADGSTTTSTGSSVAVSKYESDSIFVYYKTLERYVPITNLEEGTPQNIYPYDLIPNPFSKRPTYDTDETTKWRGFYGWRVKSISDGKIYSNANKTGEITTGTILTTEYQKLYFLPDDAGATNANNATSMTIEFEAVWARAYRVETSVANVNTNLANNTLQAGVSYERNFLVINSGNTSNTNLNATNQRPVTVMMVEPDGSADYRATTRYINPTYVIARNNLKFEWMNMQVSNTLSANAKNLVVGRGVLPAGASGSYPEAPLGDMAETGTIPNPTVTAAVINGLGATTNTNNTDYTSNVDYYVRIESGVSTNVYLASGSTGASHGVVSGSATLHVTGFLGNDYDRAKNNNNRLVVKEAVLEGTGSSNNTATTGGFALSNTANALRETMMLTMKSGYVGTNHNVTIKNGTYAASPTNSFYTAVGSSARACGGRQFVMEGGNISSLTGGMETDVPEANYSTSWIVKIRIKHNSIIRSAAFAGPANAKHYGSRRMVFTGGHCYGWVAGGCNGNDNVTNVNTGETKGRAQVYIGGTARIDSEGSTNKMNNTMGGNVFGAGRGSTLNNLCGQVTYGTTTVIADKAYVERNVYGGGDIGHAESTAKVHILGGEVDGSVFGGSNNQNGVDVELVMRGGQVNGGIYGGSNETGTISNNVTIQINGGQVGVDASHTANVHGGGLGNATRVLGNVSVAVGKQNTDNTVEGDAVIYGDVYGGSAQGKTNGNTALTAGKTTQVTINAGTINGSVYGGGLGDADYAADVYGPVTVTVNGGKVCSTSSGALGAVFGCNNANGRPQGKVNVDVTGGEMEYIYGGGNAAPYTVPTPNNFNNFHVKMSGGTVNKHVFGGGFGSNAIIEGNTEVLISGSATVKGNVYGGGNAGTVTGDTNVQIGTN